jgi:hypothetical protein
MPPRRRLRAGGVFRPRFCRSAMQDRGMKANWRIASLFLLIMIGGCSTAADSIPTTVPLDTPPNYKQMVRAAIQADMAVAKKPTKKPHAAADAKSAAKSPVKVEKINDEKAVGATPNRITRISSKYAWSEISKPRAVNVVAGWAWQVCLKGKNKDSVVYLAVFMQKNTIIDTRTSTEPDKCEGETYESL